MSLLTDPKHDDLQRQTWTKFQKQKDQLENKCYMII